MDGVEVSLTHREFELLAYLIRHRGRAITRSELMTHVWDVAEPFCDRTIDVHVRRLRSKLGVYGQRITTLRGYGYRFDG